MCSRALPPCFPCWFVCWQDNKASRETVPRDAASATPASCRALVAMPADLSMNGGRTDCPNKAALVLALPDESQCDLTNVCVRRCAQRPQRRRSVLFASYRRHPLPLLLYLFLPSLAADCSGLCCCDVKRTVCPSELPEFNRFRHVPAVIWAVIESLSSPRQVESRSSIPSVPAR